MFLVQNQALLDVKHSITENKGGPGEGFLAGAVSAAFGDAMGIVSHMTALAAVAVVAFTVTEARADLPAGPEKVTAAMPAPVMRKPVLSWETGEGKSYLIPALEVPGFLVFLNLADRLIYPNEMENGKKVYDSTPSTTWDHIRKQNWRFDQDPFNVNQFGHPYHGATMYGFARSAGLNFWESLAYSNMGSFLWEMAGETTSPSINDAIMTGQAGSMLGEVLFRMSGLVLEGNGEKPGFWRELGAGVLSPPTGFNRYFFGDRFKQVFPSHAPATFWRAQLGVNLQSRLSDNSVSAPTRREDANLDFEIGYGLPGKPGYTYKRPFDYFHFEFTTFGNVDNPVENIIIRGLLFGADYGAGDDCRGLFGLYGSYDFISPKAFRVSATAASLGTTMQWWLGRDVALQGTFMGGVGFGAAGINHPQDQKRDYHYGVTPQGLLALRFIFGKRAMIDVEGREYYVSGAGSDDSHGSETISRANAGLTVRIFDRHALGLRYIVSDRVARYGNVPVRHQTEGSLSFVYTFLGDSNFGAVEWREGATR